MYNMSDVGEIKDIETDKGTTFDETIVEVYCQICGARFIGPIREAGGFLGGHEMFHAWTFKIEMSDEMEA